MYISCSQTFQFQILFILSWCGLSNKIKLWIGDDNWLWVIKVHFFVLWNWWEFISFYLQALLHVKNLEEVRFSAEVFCKCNNSDNSFFPFSLHRFLEFRSPPNSYYLELYSFKVYNYWNVAFVANKATITLVQSFIIINTIILPEQQDKAWQQPEPKLCSSCDFAWT